MSLTIDPCIRRYVSIECFYESGKCELCEYFQFVLNDQLSKRPITSIPEQLFLTAWLHQAISDITYSIQPQVEIGKFYADFVVSGFDYFISSCYFNFEQLQIISAHLPKYAVEIDGFEWHDRNPEQAEYERRRERHIQSAGYTVLRFAAREVLRNPNPCIDELSHRVFDDIQNVFKRIIIVP